MTLTDHAGQALTPEDLAFLRAHPRIARLAVKAHKLERGTGTPDALIPETLLRWAAAILPPPPGPRQDSDPRKDLDPVSYDLLGHIFGPARRRRLETEARQAAQSALDANKETLVSLALQAVNAMPPDSAPAALHQIAQTLLTQALASPAVLARVPPAARPVLTDALAQALGTVPVPDPVHANPVGAFQIAAKVAVAQAIRSLTL